MSDTFHVMFTELSGAVTRYGKPYTKGRLKLPGGELRGFKSWDSSCEDFQALVPDLKTPYQVSATVDEKFNNDLVISSVLGTSSMEPEEFQEFCEASEERWGSFLKLMEGVLSPEGYSLWLQLIEPFSDRFKQEYAGSWMHDAEAGGLLWHSFKTTFHLFHAIKLSKNVKEHLNTDVLFIGASLHDLGKVWEYDMGSRSELEWVGHRNLLNEYFAQKRDIIEPVLGTEGYFRLLTTIAQHHGPFEERPTIVEAVLVHCADMFDASFTHVDEGLPDLKANNTPIKWQEFYLR